MTVVYIAFFLSLFGLASGIRYLQRRSSRQEEALPKMESLYKRKTAA